MRRLSVERAYLLCHLSADWATWAVPCGSSVVSVPDSAMERDMQTSYVHCGNSQFSRHDTRSSKRPVEPIGYPQLLFTNSTGA